MKTRSVSLFTCLFVFTALSVTAYSSEIDEGYPKAARATIPIKNDQGEVVKRISGTKGAIKATLHAPYEKVVALIKDLNRMKEYAHPKAIQSKVVEEGANPVVYFKVVILKIPLFPDMVRATYLKHKYTEFEDRLEIIFKNTNFKGKNGSFKSMKGKVTLYKKAGGNETDLEYQIFTNADLPSVVSDKKKAQTNERITCTLR